MKTALSKRIVALLLCCLFLLPALPVYAAQAGGFLCTKTAEAQPDGTVRITMSALQTGRVAPADIVLVLDVSASMEHNAVVSASAIDSEKDYYILYEYYYWNDDREVLRREYVPVHNTAAPGKTPTWFATLPDTGEATQIDPSATAFYTGAMEELRAAASAFVQSVAENAAQYDADHRIAVVEFSARDAKGDEALCTHDNLKHIPFYANILTGNGTAAGALVSAKSASATLQDVIAGLHGDGATYSDDAMTQAQSVLASSDRANRIVVLFTDGGPGSYGWTDDLDNSALPTANSAIAAAKRMKDSGVQIFTVGALNESDLTGSVGAKNRQYLNYISSNYPGAQSMTVPGTKTSDGYCTIGRTNMNLRDVFGAISAVIGVPVPSARVQDVVSSPFYLTDAQKQALSTAYPSVQITENDDGTTSILLEDVNFPTVATRADGTPVDPDNAGIFTISFSVTPRENFLGGIDIGTNTGACGVFAEGVQIAQFASPRVNVPVNPAALENLLSLKTVTLFAGDVLSAADLYEDLSQSDAAQYVDSVTYAVTDDAGNPFTEAVLTASQTFTVSVTVVAGGEIHTASEAVAVQVRDNPVTRLGLTSYPNKTDYFVGDALSLEGIAVTAWKRNGKSVALSADDLTASPTMFDSAGKQTVTVSYAGVSQTFTVTVRDVLPASAKVVAFPVNDTFVYRTTPDYSGLEVEITYNNGTTQIVRDLSEMTVRAQSDTRVRRGIQTFTVDTHGMRASFTMHVRLVWWQWLILILLFGWIWY